METRTIARTRGSLIAAIVTAVVLIAAAVALWWNSEDDDGERQRIVAERGAAVMPFDLEATTHRFEPTDDGGVQTVTANAPSDQDQIDLIREHLRAEAATFASGDFGDPAQIHGEEMPGLATLQANADRIEIEYTDTDTGARLRYSTNDADLVIALHDWFAAQVSDHGSHVE